jgi:hypothetical protein
VLWAERGNGRSLGVHTQCTNSVNQCHSKQGKNDTQTHKNLTEKSGEKYESKSPNTPQNYTRPPATTIEQMSYFLCKREDNPDATNGGDFPIFACYFLTFFDSL